MSVWSIALTLFLVANPIGNTPAFVSLVKDFEFERQRKILFREAIISFLLAVFFLFIGDHFLEAIQIAPYAVSVSGGTLLFLVALKMIFPPKMPNGKDKKPQEPFIVPIATPLISGGGVLSTIMIYSAKEQNDLKIFFAIIIAWIGVTLVVVSSAYLQKILGRRGLLALEQLMGMILAMISMEIIVKGILMFMKELQ
jgi:multiple antibiotic resistance protein